MAGRMLKPRHLGTPARFQLTPAGVHYLPSANSLVAATVDIYTGNGSYPVPGPKRAGGVPCLISGTWMAGHRQSVNTKDAHSHIMLVDPAIEIRDPYTGNGQTLGANADAVLFNGEGLTPATSPWRFVVFSFVTDIPGLGRRKVVLLDQISTYPSSVLLKDTFTDSDGTALASHTMDVGGGWTVTGTATIMSDQCSLSTTGYAISNAGKSDFSTAAIDVVKVQPAGIETGLYFRQTDTFNFWEVRLSTTLLALTKTVANVTTTVASVALSLTANSRHTINLSAQGSSIRANVDGGNQISTSDSFNSTATMHGFFWQTNAGPVDNLVYNQ